MDYFRLIDMLPRKMRATLKRDLKCGMLEIKKAPRKEITKIYEDATGILGQRIDYLLPKRF